MSHAGNPTSNAILDYIRTHPLKSSSQIGEGLAMKLGTVSSALTSLCKAGQIVGQRGRADSGRKAYFWTVNEPQREQVADPREDVKVCNLDAVDEKLAAKFARPEGQAPWWVVFDDVA